MRDWPTDPMRQHNRFIAAFCDDLFFGEREMVRAKRVAEINRQVNLTIPPRDSGAAKNRPETDQ